MKNDFLTIEEEALATKLVNIAFQLHKNLGPGLLESIYEKCFCRELSLLGIPFERQKPVDLIYKGIEIDQGLRIDLLVDNLIVVEIKAQENFHPVWQAQVLSYLKLTGKKVAFLFNFHVPLMKDGIKRLVLTTNHP